MFTTHLPGPGLTAQIGHEDTPTPTEVPEVKEDYVPDSHSAPGNTRSVRFKDVVCSRGSVVDYGSDFQVEI